MATFFGLSLSLLLVACGCGDSKTPKDAAPAADPKIAMTVDGVPIEKAEVERIAGFITTYFYNLSFEEACGIALVNSLIPRAASLAHFGDAAVEKQRERIYAIAKRLDAGEDFYTVGNEASDLPVKSSDNPDLEWGSLAKLDFLLGEWLFSLPIGGVSKPVLTRHGWYIMKVIEHRFPASRSHASGRFHAIICAFDKSADFEQQIRGWVNKSEIRIVDPAYDKLLPEWMKYRPGARTWRPLEISASSDGNSKPQKQ